MLLGQSRNAVALMSDTQTALFLEDLTQPISILKIVLATYVLGGVLACIMYLLVYTLIMSLSMLAMSSTEYKV